MKEFLRKLAAALAALVAPRLAGVPDSTPITSKTVGATATIEVLKELTKDDK